MCYRLYEQLCRFNFHLYLRYLQYVFPLQTLTQDWSNTRRAHLPKPKHPRTFSWSLSDPLWHPVNNDPGWESSDVRSITFPRSHLTYDKPLRPILYDTPSMPIMYDNPKMSQYYTDHSYSICIYSGMAFSYTELISQSDMWVTVKYQCISLQLIWCYDACGR